MRETNELVNRKFDEKQAIYIASKNHPLKYLHKEKKRNFTVEKLGRQHPNQVMEMRTISSGVSDKDTHRPEDAVRTKRHFWDLPSKCKPKITRKRQTWPLWGTFCRVTSLQYSSRGHGRPGKPRDCPRLKGTESPVE